MGGGLSARLKRIQQAQRAERESAEDASGSREAARVPSGWTRLRPQVIFRETAYRLDLPPAFDARPFFLKRLGSTVPAEAPLDEGAGKDASRILRERLVFIDIETTGLSTGAGTIAFAFGAGAFSGDAFVVKQIFLEDYPGEGDFIQLMLDMIPPEAVLVSYNGAAFDLGVLRTRCILSGTRFRERPHIDLLRTSRRLWARPCGGASLSLLEAAVLGSPREGDIPGAEAPERYFRYLRSADFASIEPILDHHRLDIAALPRLMDRALGVFESPLGSEGVDRARLGLMLSSLGREAWEDLLIRAYEEGEEHAGRILALLYKKRGRWSEAVRIWRGMAASGRVLRELAIAYERQGRDFQAAKDACERALALDLRQDEREAFMKRLERVNARLARKNDKKRTISD